MLKSPITICNSVDPVEKQRLFFFLFDDRLAYSKTEAFRTADSLSSIRIFEEFYEENSDDVDLSITDWNELIQELRSWENIVPVAIN